MKDTTKESLNKVVESHYDAIYKINYNVGKVKYLVSYHIKGKKHQDGSKFYDVATFKSKKKMEQFIGDLTK